MIKKSTRDKRKGRSNGNSRNNNQIIHQTANPVQNLKKSNELLSKQSSPFHQSSVLDLIHDIPTNIPPEGRYEGLFHTRKAEWLCENVGLNRSHIRKLYFIYKNADVLHDNRISRIDFFELIHEQDRPLTAGLFQYADLDKNSDDITFDSYVRMIVTFASMSQMGLFQYVFELYDEGNSGCLTSRQFKNLSLDLQSKQFTFPKNTQVAIDKILYRGKIAHKNKGDGSTCDGVGIASSSATSKNDQQLINVVEFAKFANQFPLAFFPILNMRKNIQQATLGVTTWANIAKRLARVNEMVKHLSISNGVLPPMTLYESIARCWFRDINWIREKAFLHYTAINQNKTTHAIVVKIG